MLDAYIEASRRVLPAINFRLFPYLPYLDSLMHGLTRELSQCCFS